MNARQQRFVTEYLVDLNGSAAYQRAGYKARGNAAETNAARLLRNAQVQAVIADAQAKRSERVEINQDYVLQRLKEVAEQAIKDRDGHVANRALELLGKHLGMFKDRIEHTAPDGSALVHFYLPRNGREIVQELPDEALYAIAAGQPLIEEKR